MVEISKAELEAAVVGNMIHVETVANATEPEPDVLERRLKATYETLVEAGDFPHSAKAVADAIAEIERLERLTTQQSDLARNLMSDREEAIAQLRAITEEESKHEAGHE